MKRLAWIILASLTLGGMAEQAANAQPQRPPPQQHDRDRDRGRDHDGMRDRDHRRVDRPDRAPPPMRKEFARPRRGQVWIPGSYEWRDGGWRWTSGHYEKRRFGQRWVPGRWDQSGDSWSFNVGGWAAVSVLPNIAPPPAVEERARPRRGFVWVRGHQEWIDGQYVWMAGHYERQQAGRQWIDGRWDQYRGQWVWTPGAWQ